MSIHLRIRRLREALDLTQEQLGAKLGVGKSAVCHWERGRRLPPAGEIKRLATALKTTVARLYGERPA